MRRFPFIICVLLVATGCEDRSKQISTMNFIEQSVAMPSGAEKIGRYARFYAPTPSGEVLGIYVLGKHDGLGAGQRRWMSDVGDLPAIADGGCEMVSVSLDVKTNAVSPALCNDDG